MSGLELLHALRESECDHTVIKIKIKGDDRPLIGVVDQIVGKDVVFKPYTLYGEKIHRAIVSITDIEKLMKIHLTYANGIFPLGSRSSVSSPTVAPPIKRARKRLKTLR
jgi:hypothetical protein